MSGVHSQSFHSVHSVDSKPDSVTRSNAMLFMSEPEPKDERPLRKQGVISFLACVASTIVFLCAFGGPEWFILPPINYSNITATSSEGMRIYVEILRSTCDLSPAHLPRLHYECPVTFGIWRLCYREHCVYDVSNNYRLVNYLPYEDVRRPFDDVITPIQWMMCFALIFTCVAWGGYLAYLSDIHALTGVAAVAGQGMAGVLTLVAVITFGVAFRGPTDSAPFGWTFYFGIAALCMFILNGAFFLIVILATLQQMGRFRGCGNLLNILSRRS